MTGKEAILAALLAVFGNEPPALSVGITDLNHGTYGITSCTLKPETGPQCKILYDSARLRDRSPASTGVRMSGAEATTLHEMCHAKVYFDVANEAAGPRPQIVGVATANTGGTWHIHDEEAFSFRSHGRAWRTCMRQHRAWVDPNIRH